MTQVDEQLGTTLSGDGTTISWLSSGSGPALILVHGSVGDHRMWWPAIPMLQRYFKVVRLDRRGRGSSGDASEHSLAREAEDVAAVARSLEQPVSLMGHAYGALCCLEATLLMEDLRKVVLYDLPVAGLVEAQHPGLLPRLEEMRAEGRQEEVLTTVLGELLGLPAPAVEQLRATNGWPDQVEAAASIPRELRVADGYRLDADRFALLKAPVLALSSRNGPAQVRELALALEQALPNCQADEVPKQFAVSNSTEEFMSRVLRFLGMRRVAVKFPSLQAPEGGSARYWFDLG